MFEIKPLRNLLSLKAFAANSML